MSPSRRDFLRRATGAALTGAGTLAGLRGALAASQAPAIVGSDRDRPSSAFGVTAGDVDGDRAIIWSRTDRPSRLVVEYSTTAAFADVRRVTGPTATRRDRLHRPRRPARRCPPGSASSIAPGSRARTSAGSRARR